MRQEILNKIKIAPIAQINLEKLHIQDSEIEEIAQEIINQRPRIKIIFLNNNLLSDEGAVILANKASNLRNLVILDLQFNNIGKKGAIAIFSLSQNNEKLSISFHGNKIYDVGQMMEIENAIKSRSL